MLWICHSIFRNFKHNSINCKIWEIIKGNKSLKPGHHYFVQIGAQIFDGWILNIFHQRLRQVRTCRKNQVRISFFSDARKNNVFSLLFPRKFHRLVDQFDEFFCRRETIHFDDLRQCVSRVVTNLGDEADEVGPRKGLDFDAQVHQIGSASICVTFDEKAAKTSDALEHGHRVSQDDSWIAVTVKNQVFIYVFNLGQ